MQKDSNRQEVLSEDNGYACKGEEEECGQMLKMSSCWEIGGRQEDGRARSPRFTQGVGTECGYVP